MKLLDGCPLAGSWNEAVDAVDELARAAARLDQDWSNPVAVELADIRAALEAARARWLARAMDDRRLVR
jgi:hypothetical protein